MPALGPPGALSPADWQAQIDYDSWRDLFSPDDGVAAHHGGGSDYPAGRPPYSIEKEAAQLRSWEQHHLNKGWRGLAYGWGVGLSGAIFRIRGWARYGAHTGDVDGDGIANNDEIVPIIIIGSGFHHSITPAAHESIVRLRRFIEEGSPRATRLYGHKELKGIVTSCPGPNFMSYVEGHRYLPEEGDVMTPEQEAKLDRVLEIVDSLPEILEALPTDTSRRVHRRTIDDPFTDDDPWAIYMLRRTYIQSYQGHAKAREALEIVKELAKTSGLTEATIDQIASEAAEATIAELRAIYAEDATD